MFEHNTNIYSIILNRLNCEIFNFTLLNNLLLWFFFSFRISREFSGGVFFSEKKIFNKNLKSIKKSFF